ncbi:unnamed protein product [Zymoseptoria tritici ST99CH_3D1]|nr:unnamed protein product [Zymoseptoria tritici ST99CH_3D1]
MVRLAQTVALLLAAIPTALAVDICQCKNDRYTYGACQLAIKATANPPKARRGLDRVPPGDDPIHPPHKDPPTTRNYPFWTYYWDRDDKKGYCYYQWSGDPTKSSIWHFFANHCPTGASCLG